MRRLSVLLLFPLVIACNDEITDPPPPETNRVIATPESRFQPPSVSVRVGGTVTWEFQSLAHSVRFETKPGAPNNIEEPLQNTTEGRRFDAAGSYEYNCGVHPTMFGIVNVIAP